MLKFSAVPATNLYKWIWVGTLIDQNDYWVYGDILTSKAAPFHNVYPELFS
jgi:hypothetical protein